jgi:hypothetical protein
LTGFWWHPAKYTANLGIGKVDGQSNTCTGVVHEALLEQEKHLRVVIELLWSRQWSQTERVQESTTVFPAETTLAVITTENDTSLIEVHKWPSTPDFCCVIPLFSYP